MKNTVSRVVLASAIVALGYIPIVSAKSCFSDYNCGIGYSCVKDLYKSTGTCMKTVNQFGIQQFNMPRNNSMNIRGYNDAQCQWDTDCPIGFRCDYRSKVCIKR